MRSMRRRALAVCMAALLAWMPCMTLLAEDAPEAGRTDGESVLSVSGGDACAVSSVSDGDAGNDSVLYADGDNIASGKDGDITWVIDANGKLTLTGTGNRAYINSTPAWCSYRDQITSAEVQVSGMTDASYLFDRCSELESVDMSSFDTSSVTNMGGMFINCSSLTSLDVSSFDTSSVTSMGYMFSGCSELESVDMSSFDTSSVTSIGYMFYGCSGLTSVDMSSFDTSSVTNMRCMFYGCSSMTSVDMSSFDTSSVTNMHGMFDNCSSLTNLDVSSFDTSSVTSMGQMFYRCSSLTSVDLSSFDTSSVTSMEYMFDGCSSLTNVNLSSFDTNSVKGMSAMFSGCSSLTSLDLSSFDASSVTKMTYMFSSCNSLVQLRTPYNVKVFCSLPSDADNPWYLPDGVTVVTELPMNLEESVTLTRAGSSTDAPNIASGQDGDITWVIDANGKLTLTGTGNRASTSSVWCSDLYRFQITSAEVKVSGMTDATYLFYYCSNLESVDVSEFDTSSVTGMAGMFCGCSSLTSVDLSSFDTSSVTDMRSMFCNCSGLTSLDVSGFDTSNVMDMSDMFDGCSSLTSVDLNSFDTSSVTDMFSMFFNCSSLTSADLSSFDTSSVTNMGVMFYGCSGLTSLGLSGFDTSSVTYMQGMFTDCSSLTSLDLSSFDTSSVEEMWAMFSGCSGLRSLNVSSFDTSSVTYMNWMFGDCSGLTSLDLSGFDASSVTDMADMFSGCSSLIQLRTPYNVQVSCSLPSDAYNPNSWYLPDGVTVVTELPMNLGESVTLTCADSSTDASNIASGKDGDITWVIDANGKLTLTGVGNRASASSAWCSDTYRDLIALAEVQVSGMTDALNLFYDCRNLESVDVSGFDTSSVTGMEYMFYGCRSLTSVDMSSFDTSSVKSMAGMFLGCSSLTSVDLSSFDTSSVTSMFEMFSNCSSLTSVDLSSFDTSNVTNMGVMFSNCSSLTSVDLSSFDTSSVIHMFEMFSDCSSLTNLDLSSFDTSSVKSMVNMFSGCSSLTSVDLSRFDTSNVTGMRVMFSDCSSLTSVDLSSFDTSSVTHMQQMFYGCSSLTSLDLSSFDAGNVTDMTDMFYGCSGLEKLRTPINVHISCSLPVIAGSLWYRQDIGEPLTELPIGLEESVLLILNPQITTTTSDLEMENVIRIKYVPYSITLETNNTDPDNIVVFQIIEGRLAEGLEMDPATGEIYGVPLEAGEFPITVQATYSNPNYYPSTARLILTVLENTDENMGNASDPGYYIINPVTGFEVGAVSVNDAQTLVSEGEYSQFQHKVYLDGRLLEEGEGKDYTSGEGSTRITIMNQTLSRGGAGTHTLGIVFKGADGTLKRAAQNYVITLGSGTGTPDSGTNTPDSGTDTPDSGTSTPDRGTGMTGSNTGSSGGNAPSDTPGIPAASDEQPRQEFIIYTVEKGDSLWKIAVKFYGRGNAWRIIFEDNRAVLISANRLYKGQKLRIRLNQNISLSQMIPAAASGNLEGSTYIIQGGDSLWRIAGMAYGSGRLWRLIYEVNRDIIADPDRIRGGQSITIPKR